MTTVSVGPIVAESVGEGPAVLMIHGLGGTANMFQPQLAALEAFRVIRLDLPGSGRSPRPIDPPTLDAMSEAVAKALSGLGVTRAHLVGHSMGTIVCQWLAVNRPELVASLALLGALAEPAEATRTGLAARAKLARSGGLSDIADQIIAAALSAHTKENNPAAVAFVRESILRQDPESYARSCEALAKSSAVEARRISAPTLLLTGEDDAVNPPSVARTLADKIKGAVYAGLERCGHWATVESPAAVNRRLTDFLRQVER